MSVERSVISLAMIKALQKKCSAYFDGVARSDGGGDVESESEGCSGAKPALHGNLAAEQLDESNHKGEPQSGALVMRCIEAPENVGQPLSLDAPARVLHEELHLVLLFLRL